MGQVLQKPSVPEQRTTLLVDSDDENNIDIAAQVPSSSLARGANKSSLHTQSGSDHLNLDLDPESETGLNDDLKKEDQRNAAIRFFSFIGKWIKRNPYLFAGIILGVVLAAAVITVLVMFPPLLFVLAAVTIKGLMPLAFLGTMSAPAAIAFLTVATVAVSSALVGLVKLAVSGFSMLIDAIKSIRSIKAVKGSLAAEEVSEDEASENGSAPASLIRTNPDASLPGAKSTGQGFYDEGSTSEDEEDTVKVVEIASLAKNNTSDAASSASLPAPITTEDSSFEEVSDTKSDGTSFGAFESRSQAPTSSNARSRSSSAGSHASNPNNFLAKSLSRSTSQGQINTVTVDESQIATSSAPNN